MTTTAAPTALVEELRAVLGAEAVLTTPEALLTYDSDGSMIVSHPPDIVVLPTTAEQVAEAVRLANRAGLAIVARGAGTGIAGGAVPLRGGLMISTARMDKILAVDTRSRLAVVQPGVVNADLNAYLAPLGYQFAPDPSSQRASTIGGNIATNAGGPHCLKYGVTSNHVLAVEVVDHAGSRYWTGDGVLDQSGYDLTGLMTGSEGTLGIVTAAIVRLTPLPEAVRVVLALFPSVVAAAAAVSAVIAAGSLPTSLEVMDHNAIRAVNSAYSLGLPETTGTTALIIEVDGVEDGLDDQLDQIIAICRDHGAFDLRPARDPATQARVWTARKSVAGAIGRLAPAYYLVDTVVPRTKLPLMMEHVERLRAEYGMEVCNVFHAGDGNLHPLVLYDPRDPDQRRRAHDIAAGVLERSLANGGVVSGEHGIGLEKCEYMPRFFSPAELQLHATIHHVFNPTGCFNPAKIFPTDTTPAALAAARAERLQRRDPVHGAAAPEPGAFVAPETPAAAAVLMKACYHAGLSVIPTGGTMARSPQAVTISTKEWHGPLVYEPDDLTIKVAAGTTLAELQALLAPHNQMLPLDVADPHRSIGSLVATAADGPRRLGYGALRDWVLALDVLEPDGEPVRLGAQVVKNVTGYDLVKLYTGSYGTLGLITAVALKVFPQPPAGATAIMTMPTSVAACALIDDLSTTRLLPTAVEYLADAGAFVVAVRAEGHPAAVERHMREVTELAHRHNGAWTVVAGADETSFWQQTVARYGAVTDQTLLRLSVWPSRFAATLQTIEQAARRQHVEVALTAHALSGIIYLRVTGDPAAIAAYHAELYHTIPHTRLLVAPPHFVPQVSVWGLSPTTLNRVRALKVAIDPHNTLNPTAVWFANRT
ncbi:FAD-binding oxidoreductase [Chloroflexus aggregans]|uniref:D-lactate dehydrogenase (Cytochrome) n=1 Tax=Chloroflexus aggregans (strain MD-66 / DSM 9485) TaxID=326427 RepID=B8G9E2_CHLAD|nr:FAD-binding oxidoreductase [Chloroflexus aggregans]ACL24432.1 D-lactate dehydrogenase (cytochrome) [Chloroflexus aggregans DSM 9485]